MAIPGNEMQMNSSVPTGGNYQYPGNYQKPGNYQTAASDLVSPSPSGIAIASLVTGILAVVFFWGGWLFAATAVAAVVTGASASRAAKAVQGRTGVATAGLVLGIVALVIDLLMIASVGWP
ncbi:MAG: hypothetical protein ACYCST_14215 [Acidimicrobiales bacterium]